MNATRKFEVSANGHSFGIFEAATEQEAIDLCCIDAGYQSEAEMIASLERPSDLIVGVQHLLDCNEVTGGADHAS